MQKSQTRIKYKDVLKYCAAGCLGQTVQDLS